MTQLKSAAMPLARRASQLAGSFVRMAAARETAATSAAGVVASNTKPVPSPDRSRASTTESARPPVRRTTGGVP